jgi:hypothetical protein
MNAFSSHIGSAVVRTRISERRRAAVLRRRARPRRDGEA